MQRVGSGPRHEEDPRGSGRRIGYDPHESNPEGPWAIPWKPSSSVGPSGSAGPMGPRSVSIPCGCGMAASATAASTRATASGCSTRPICRRTRGPSVSRSARSCGWTGHRKAIVGSTIWTCFGASRPGPNGGRDRRIGGASSAVLQQPCAGRHQNQVGIGVERRDLARELLRQPEIILIAGRQIVASGQIDATIAGVADPEIAFVHGQTQSRIRIPPHQVRRPVGRTVVDDEELEVRPGLGQDRIEGRADEPSAVARGDDDAHPGAVSGVDVVVRSHAGMMRARASRGVNAPCRNRGIAAPTGKRDGSVTPASSRRS